VLACSVGVSGEGVVDEDRVTPRCVELTVGLVADIDSLEDFSAFQIEGFGQGVVLSFDQWKGIPSIHDPKKIGFPDRPVNLFTLPEGQNCDNSLGYELISDP
jgi:hypothetical protein